MDKALMTAATAAMNRLADHAAVVRLSNTDEFTFRSFFLYELMKVLPSAQCETEWQRVDLLVRHLDENTLIEFKHYLHRRSMLLDGSPANWKGGPGPKNEEEFKSCIKQLHRCAFTPVQAKYIVLVYERSSPRKSRYCFSRSYDRLTAGGPLLEVIDIHHKLEDSVTCKLLRIA